MFQVSLYMYCTRRFFSCKVIQWRKRPRILADPIPTTLKFFAGTVVLLSFSKNTLRMWAWDKQAQSPTDNIVQYVRNGFLLGRYFVLYSCIYFLFNESSLKKPKKEYYLVSIMGKCFFKAQLLITSFTFSTFTKSIYLLLTRFEHSLKLLLISVYNSSSFLCFVFILLKVIAIWVKQ